jgi:hypothetical protein
VANDFPMIALAPGPIDTNLFPSTLKRRLCVSMLDDNWEERIAAVAEHRKTAIPRPAIEPYAIEIHERIDGGFDIEVRPRSGAWSPFISGVPIEEKTLLAGIRPGPRGHPPSGGYRLIDAVDGPSEDGRWYVRGANHEVTPVQSFYLFCPGPALPSELIFGGEHGPQYSVELSKIHKSAG